MSKGLMDLFGRTARRCCQLGLYAAATAFHNIVEAHRVMSPNFPDAAEDARHPAKTGAPNTSTAQITPPYISPVQPPHLSHHWRIKSVEGNVLRIDDFRR